ncbi:ABC transporter permease [Devosia chinhatensis]|uniref:ABC transporter permease n=1 Tax=Devosia chinhatensis TaxID=429727 RepID=A0A0F5FJ57_9HYPH|nr:ABC transporter permease [Devosia chinhatensis]
MAGWRWELASLPLLLIVWQVLAIVVAHRLFPTPLEVTAEIVRVASQGPLLADLAKTLARATSAFVIAMVLGTVLGLLLGRQAILDRLFSAWLVVGLNLPAIVVAIVLYIWLGLTESALVAAVVINKMPLVIVTVREGVRSFSNDYEELSRALRLDFRQQLAKIYWPQLLPFMLAAARTGLSLIWKIVLVFEVLGSDGGVGYRVSVLFQFFDVQGILAYTASFIAVVLAFEYGLLRPLERRALAWRQT